MQTKKAVKGPRRRFAIGADALEEENLSRSRNTLLSAASRSMRRTDPTNSRAVNVRRSQTERVLATTS